MKDEKDLLANNTMSNELFQKTITNLQNDLYSLHSDRISPALVEDVVVMAYDSEMKLQEVASISVPEPQTIQIQPWDKTLTKAIETALRECDLHLQPVVDGETIRISFPPLTEERRKEIVKVMHEKVELARIAIRKTREEILRGLKDQEKNGDISEDDYFGQEKDIQKEVDSYNNQIKELADKKESALMKI